MFDSNRARGQSDSNRKLLELRLNKTVIFINPNDALYGTTGTFVSATRTGARVVIALPKETEDDEEPQTVTRSIKNVEADTSSGGVRVYNHTHTHDDDSSDGTIDLTDRY